MKGFNKDGRPRKQHAKRTDARNTCKICGKTPAEVEFGNWPSRGSLPEYCQRCNVKALNRKRWLALHKNGSLQALIARTEQRLADMMNTRDMFDAGKHPINW